MTSQRKLSFYAYAAYVPENTAWPDSHTASLQQLQVLGVPVNPEYACVTALAEVQQYITHIANQRSQLAYGIDGVVLKVNDVSLQQQLGFTARAPRWAVAYKFPAEIAVAQVLGIDAQVGRTGVITPVANLKPVAVGGVVVQHVTLHNYAELARKDVRVGDWVQVRRAGDVIPEIVRVDQVLSVQRQQKPDVPTQCPSCQRELIADQDQTSIRCPGGHACRAQLVDAVWHFASRKAVFIEGMGPSVIALLIDGGWVKNVADLYDVTQSMVQGLPRMGAKSASNLVNSIEKAKQRPWHRVLYGLGIREVGSKTAQILAKHYPTWQQLAAADQEALARIDHIGPVMAQFIHGFFQEDKHIRLLQRLADYGVIAAEQPVVTQGVLTGKRYVITGKFAQSRNEIKALLEALGAEVNDSISKTTSALIVGEKAGSKVAKAEKLGIPCIGVDALDNLLNQR